MPSNHLEDLVAQWYEYKEYFVRRNVLVGKRAKGGWAGELDVVVFDPRTRAIKHIETSGDSDRWDVREKRFRHKFEMGRQHIPGLFKGLGDIGEIESIAVLSNVGGTSVKSVGGGRVVPLRVFLEPLVDELKKQPWLRQAVPESFPLIRTIQMVGNLFVD